MTKNSFEHRFHSDLENENSPISMCYVTLESLLSLCIISNRQFLETQKFFICLPHFFCLHIPEISFQSVHLALSYGLKLFFFFQCLFTRAFKSLYLSVVWLQFLCRMQFFFTVLQSTEDSLLDFTTIELESSCFLFLLLLLSFFFLREAKDHSYFLVALGFLHWSQRNHSCLW